MRVWDIEPDILCRNHLLGEHNEIHALWTILTQNRKGYIHHPETRRWVGRLAALYQRHEAIVAEMKRRGYKHASVLDKTNATGQTVQTVFVNSIDEQCALLRLKGCSCSI